MDPAIDPERDLVKSKIMVLILDGKSEHGCARVRVNRYLKKTPRNYTPLSNESNLNPLRF